MVPGDPAAGVDWSRETPPSTEAAFTGAKSRDLSQTAVGVYPFAAV